MDEEQGLASPIAGGIRGIRRSVSSSVFTGRAVAPPPPDPQVTSLLNQNSLTLGTVSGQLSNVSAQIGQLNNSLASIKSNLAISDQLDRQREAAKQKREAILAEQSLREGKESDLERKVQNALLSPVRRVAVKAQGILSRLSSFLLILAGGWLVDQTLTFLRLKSDGNVDALNDFKVRFFGNLALITGIAVALTVGLTKIIGLVGTLAGTILRIAFSGLVVAPIKAVLRFIRVNTEQFRKNIANAGKNFFKRVPKAMFNIVKKPVGALVGLGLSLPLIGPALKQTGKFMQKVPIVGNLFKPSAATGGVKGFGGPLTAVLETLGFGFDVRNRMKKDDDGDGVGDQTAVQAVTGAGANTIASLTTFFTGLALIPEGVSTGVGLIGLLGLSLFSGFVGDQAANVADSITGVTPPGQTGGDGDGSGNGMSLLDAGSTNGDAESITPASKNNNGQNLVYSEESNIVNVPLANSNTNAGGEGGASPAGGSADIIPNIRSSDNSNTFPALAGSMFNIADF